ncbi:hypothetical protein NCC49_004825 [Naganishia albida]|nr:hypothetical protein NCC49_004825 [Naganishia albida]
MTLPTQETWLDKITASYRLNIHPSATSNKCEDPYALPGFLNVNTTHISENRWIPMDEDCQTPRMFEALRRGPKAVSEIGMREGWKDMKWVRNRTVVMFGDSVARENIVYFCELIGAKLDRVTWDHPYAPSPRPTQTPPPLAQQHFVDETPEDPDADPELVRNWKPKPTPGEGDHAHFAHICHVQEWGLLLVQQFQYGMDQEDYWAFKPGYIPPGTYEARLHTLLHPVVQRAITALQPHSPSVDLVMLNSAFWDTARWISEDMRFGRDLDAGLSRQRLNWYRTRIRQAVAAVREMWPGAAISWVTHHYPTGNGPSDWFTSGIQAQGAAKTATRPGNTVLRLTELDAAVRSAFTPYCLADCTPEQARQNDVLSRVRVNEWGRIMLGQEKHMKDALHQRMVPGGRLWADMMLFDLWRAVRR